MCETDSEEWKYTEIRLPWRKTDQNGDGSTYQLYDDLRNEPGVQARARLTTWIEFMYIYFNKGSFMIQDLLRY